MSQQGLRGVFLAALCGLVCYAGAYYVPGTYPHPFRNGEGLRVQVNSLRSYETELPYKYYSLPFCKPSKEEMKKAQGDANPGTILLGLRIEASNYTFNMLEEEYWKHACEKETAPALSEKDAHNMQEKIKDMYWVNMVLDNLPITTYDLTVENLTYVRTGFPLGFQQDDKYYVNNHLSFHVLVHPRLGKVRAKSDGNLVERGKKRRALQDLSVGDVVSGDELEALSRQSGRHLTAGRDDEYKLTEEEEKEAEYMVVGFEVMPCSINLETIKKYKQDPTSSYPCGPNVSPGTHQEVKAGSEIPYTYDVTWGLRKLQWASRWDAYLKMPGGKVHWFSILNSVLVVIVMAVVCAMILIRTVRRDLARYEELIMDGGPTASDLKEEAGWKMVSGDVFRAPSNASGLAVRVGSGIQIMCTAIVTTFFAAIGFLSPASRGSLLTGLLVLYLLLAVTAGMGTVWIWGIITRTYDGWRGMCWKVALYFPGITMLIFTFVNMCIHHTGSTGAIPVSTYFAIVTLWFIVSIPLTFVGGYLATRIRIIDYPTRTNQIPRHIPAPPLGTHPWLIFLISGLLPFGTLFMELYFVMSSMWMGYFYYLFGYLALIGLLTFLITIEVSVLCTYVQLCAEDYMLWWRSFYRGGSIALYLMVYALFFLTTTPLSGFLSVMLYLCYMGILVWGIYLAMGTLGFLSSCVFTYAIFSTVKVE